MRVLVALFVALFGATVQNSTPREADGILAQLSKISLDKKQIHSIRDVTLRRDVLSISLSRGIIAFSEPVAGKITGAVFIGSGEIVAIPPDPIEKQQIYKFTGTPLLDETFQTAVLRFTDSTYEEIQRELSQHAEEDLSPAERAQFDAWDQGLAERGQLLNARILADFVEPAAKQPLFFAALNSDRFGWFNAVTDLRAAEEVSIFQLHDIGGAAVADVWAKFNQRSKARNREASAHAVKSPTEFLAYSQDSAGFAYMNYKVMSASYHDEWLCEGLTRYLAVFNPDDADSTALRSLLDGALEELRPVENAGPIWLGRRLASTRSPMGYKVVYSKGLWVIHMLRELLPNAKFQEMIREFAQTYNAKTASTWDFQHLAEKYAGRKLDWFFDDWVFGMGVPKYALDYKVESAGDAFIIQGKIKQSNVSDDFTMPVPLYADDQFLGSVSVSEDDGDFRFQVAKKPEKVLIDPKGKVLSFSR
jgi:hypothetical protein